MRYRAIYNTVRYNEDWLIEHGKRQARLVMELRRLNDELPCLPAPPRFVPTVVIPLLVPFGAILGAILGITLVASL